MEITEHPTMEGKIYLAVVLDALSGRVIGWSLTDHMRAELVADALQMAAWRAPVVDRPSAPSPLQHEEPDTREPPIRGGLRDLGNEYVVMSEEKVRADEHRYTQAEKEQALVLVRQIPEKGHDARRPLPKSGPRTLGEPVVA